MLHPDNYIMKKCFSLTLLFLIFFSEAFSQSENYVKREKIRDLLQQISAKVDALELLFLVPGNIYIESGDAPYALVELGKMQYMVKKLEGRVEAMEHELEFQIKVLKKLNAQLLPIIKGKADILDLETKEENYLGTSIINKKSDEKFLPEVKFISDLDIVQQADLFFKKGMYEKAITNYEKLIEENPNSSLLPEAFFKLAESQYKMDEWQKAAASYLEAFSLEPKGPFAPRALFGLAVSLGAFKKFDQACLTLEEVQLRFPSQALVSETEIQKAKQLLSCI